MVRPDASYPDAAEPEDAGRTGLCAQEPNPMCMRAADCMDDSSRPTNCGGCFAYNKTLCATNACETPALLGNGDIHNVVFQVGILQTELQSFAGHVIDAKTAGGNTITCEDVYAKTVDLADPCYNILDVRAFREIARQESTYTMSFSAFASGRHVLFVIHGYALQNADGNPIGISCTAYDVGAPGMGAEVSGDMMRRIQ